MSSSHRGGSLLRVLLLAALGVLAIWLWRLRSDEPDVVTPGEFAAGEMFENPIRVVFRSRADSIVVERVDDEYWVTYPVQDRAWTGRIAQTIRSIRNLKAERVLPDTSATAFGLRPPRHRVEVESASGERWGLDIGDVSPLGSSVYARPTEGGPILLLSEFGSRRDLYPELGQLRDPAVLMMTSPIVDSVRIEHARFPLHAARISKELWISRTPAGLALDPLPINRGLSHFRSPSIRGYLDRGVDLASLGLDPPRATWIVYQGSRIETVRVGNANPEDPATAFVIPSQREYVALVASDFYRDFVDGWPRIAQRRLLTMPPDSVRSVEFLAGGDGGYSRDAENGWIRDPGRRVVSASEAVDRDVSNLGELKWYEYPLEPRDTPRGDLLRLRIASATAAETLAIVSSPGDTTAFAWSSDRRRWGRIPRSQVRIWTYRGTHLDL